LVGNPHALPVLLAEGETLKGGLQNRVINVSVLIAALDEVEIPVSCVEAGRWRGGHDFHGRGIRAPRRVRRGATFSVNQNILMRPVETRKRAERQADQGLIWNVIDQELLARGIDDGTRALEALAGYEGKERRVAEAINELTVKGPLPGQCGLVVSHGGRVVAAEVFGTEKMLAASWESLIRGVMLEAGDVAKGSPSATRALRFLEQVGKNVVSVEPGVGLGEELRISTPRLAGQALVHLGALVHASAFALGRREA
jgi:hypothetical protein